MGRWPRSPTACGRRLLAEPARGIALCGQAQRRSHRFHRHRARGGEPSTGRRAGRRLLPDRVEARYPRSAVDRHQRRDRKARRQAGGPRHQRGARARHTSARGGHAGSRYGVEVCPIIIRQRAVFSHALVGSKCAQEVEPASKAAAEVAALWDWLARRATGQNQSEAASMAAA